MSRHARAAKEGVQAMATENDRGDRYREGYTEGRQETMTELAEILRIRVCQSLPHGETLSQPMAREIYTAMFGVHECDQEFGTVPGDEVVPGPKYPTPDTGALQLFLDEGVQRLSEVR